VAFAIEAARFRPCPERLGLNFLETNLRTYVLREGREPGVYFFSLEAASRLAVAGARLAFGLPYHHARMVEEVLPSRTDYTLERLSGRRPRLRVSYRVGAPLGPSVPGTAQHFLIERYFLHVKRRGALWTARVAHPPYPVQAAEVLSLEESLLAANGIPAPGRPPDFVHYSPGVDVGVFAP